MDPLAIPKKPHAVCVPFPAQGHISPMLKMAKILHHRGFHITFVNTEYNHKRLLKSQGPESLNGLPSFRFHTIPDGLPESDAEVIQYVPYLFDSTRKYCLAPLRKLLRELNDTASSNVPPVTCIVSDGSMSFTLDAAAELGIPQVLFWTTSACAFMAYVQYRHLIEKGLIPLKDASYLTNGYLDTVIDWIPGMKDIRLRDLPTFLRTTEPDNFIVNFIMLEIERTKKASAVILNTFDALEHEVLDALSSMFPPIYSVGPLQLFVNQIPNEECKLIGSNLWKEEEDGYWGWLDKKDPKSVVYVNFGTSTIMTSDQFLEFAWGLANSNQTFFWIVRSDLVEGKSAVLPPEFSAEIQERGLLASWCRQEQVLSHPSIGGFLTHSGWNSTTETLCSGVPIISWPFFADQQTNCRYCCNEWGIGMEIEGDVKREKIESLIRELMVGEKGKGLKNKAAEWKKLAEEATSGPTGSSYANIDKMINEVILSKTA